MTAPVPKRAVLLDISIQADNRQAMIDALDNIARRIAMQEMTRGCSGGYDSGYTYNYEENEGPTHDEYAKQLNDWLAEVRREESAHTDIQEGP